MLLANAYLQQNNPQAALKVLLPLGGDAAGIACRLSLCAGPGLPDVGRYGRARRRSSAGIYLTQPLSFEAAQARTQLQAMGVPLTAAERKTHADELFNAKRYAEAGEEYHAIARDSDG